MPVLLVEHDIDRVFALADRVTAMNEGRVLVDGTADEARESQAVQRDLYRLGHRGARREAARHAERAGGAAAPRPRGVDTFYGKSHVLHGSSLAVHEREIVALLGRNGAGKSTLLKTIIGIVTARRRAGSCSPATISRGACRSNARTRHRPGAAGSRPVRRSHRAPES